MKKFLAMAMAMMMALSMAACGGTEEPAPAEDAEVVEEVTDEADGGSDDFTLWDIATVETPDLADTTWNFCGGYLEDGEMSQEDGEAALEMYGGKLQFVFNADGTAEMVQGGGSLQGTYQYLEDGSVGVVFDNNGADLPYVCLFTDLDGLTMVAISDESGTTGIYFAQ